MKRVVLASGNVGKLREMGALLLPLGFDLVTQNSLGIHSVAGLTRFALEKGRR